MSSSKLLTSSSSLLVLSMAIDDKIGLLKETNKKVSLLPPPPANLQMCKRTTPTTHRGSDTSNSLCGGHSSGCSPKIQKLEDLADALKAYMHQKEMLKDRKANRMAKTIRNCFVGSEAVTALQYLLNERKYTPGAEMDDSNPSVFEAGAATRENAIEAGSEMIRLFQFFSHTTDESKIELLDSPTEFYKLDQNLPCQVRNMKRLYPTAWDKMRLLEEHVEVKDRRHLLRSFPDCFVASEAVDVLMDLKVVKSRKEAVHLIRKLNKKVHCCEHVTNDHEFEDANLFFQFIPASERMPEPSKRSGSPKRTNTKESNHQQKKFQRAKTWDESTRKEHNRDSTGSQKSTEKGLARRRERNLSDTNQKRALYIRQSLANHKLSD